MGGPTAGAPQYDRAMSRLSGSSRSRSGARARTLSGRTAQWTLLNQAAAVLRDGGGRPSAADRARLTFLLKASRGRPMHLTPQQRTEVAAILARTGALSLERELAPGAGRQAARRRAPLRRG